MAWDMASRWADDATDGDAQVASAGIVAVDTGDLGVRQGVGAAGGSVGVVVPDGKGITRARGEAGGVSGLTCDEVGLRDVGEAEADVGPRHSCSAGARGTRCGGGGQRKGRRRKLSRASAWINASLKPWYWTVGPALISRPLTA